jgi:hypothetical protein
MWEKAIKRVENRAISLYSTKIKQSKVLDTYSSMLIVQLRFALYLKFSFLFTLFLFVLIVFSNPQQSLSPIFLQLSLSLSLSLSLKKEKQDQIFVPRIA